MGFLLAAWAKRRTLASKEEHFCGLASLSERPTPRDFTASESDQIPGQQRVKGLNPTRLAQLV